MFKKTLKHLRKENGLLGNIFQVSGLIVVGTLIVYQIWMCKKYNAGFATAGAWLYAIGTKFKHGG